MGGKLELLSSHDLHEMDEDIACCYGGNNLLHIRCIFLNGDVLNGAEAGGHDCDGHGVWSGR